MNDRKTHVLLTAQRLFTNKGFFTTSVQDIIDESKISKGTFYNYFSSKNECLIAIIENAHEAFVAQRREILVGNRKDDKSILAEQILIRLRLNREMKLLPIYEAVFHSSDDELRNFVKQLHYDELRWFTTRLIDVYGKDSEKYVVDCAIMIYGAIHQLIHFWSATSPKSINLNDLVHFTIRRLDAIMFDLMKNKDSLLGKHFLDNLFTNETSSTIMKEQLIAKLQSLLNGQQKDGHDNRLQYIEFLIEELSAKEPRLFIIESVNRSLREVYADSNEADRINEVVSLTWKYIDKMQS